MSLVTVFLLGAELRGFRGKDKENPYNPRNPTPKRKLYN